MTGSVSASMSPVNKDTCATVVEAQGDGAVVETVRRAAIDGDELRRGVQHDAPCLLAAPSWVTMTHA